MATFNSKTFSTSNQYIKFRIRCTEVGSDIVNSTTKVKVQIQAWRTNTGYTTYGNGTANLYVGDRTFTQSITTSDKISYNSYTTLLQVTIDVPRGILGNATTRMYARWSIGSAVTTSLEEYTFSFTPLNRYALITDVSAFTDETNPVITFTNPAGVELVSDLKIRMKWTNSEEEEETTEYFDIPDEDWSGGTYEFDISDYSEDMTASCPDSNLLPVTFELQSTMGESQYTHTRVATMMISNANPIFTVLPRYEDANQTVVEITGDDQIIIQKQSKLRIYSGTANAQKGASLIAYPYTVVFNGQEYVFVGQYIEFDKPDLAGEYPIIVKAVDTRGNIGESSFSLTIYELSEPTAVYSVARVNGFESDTIINVDGKISEIEGNVLSISEKHRELNTSAWSDSTSLPDAEDYHLTLDNTKEWEISITVSDSFASKSYTATIGKGIPITFTDIFHNSFGVCGLPDADNQLYVGGDIKATGDVNAGVYTNTTIADCLEKAGGSSNVQSVHFSRAAMVNQMSITLRTTASISSGSNIWSGYLGDKISSHKPAVLVYGSGYYNALNIGVTITDTGVLTIRNASPASIASGATCSVSIIWISN